MLQISRHTLRGASCVVGGILIHLSLGTLYTFGNLNPYMTSYMRSHGTSKDLTYTECAWVFALAAMGQGMSMFFGGIIEKKIGPRLTTLLGGWLMSLGVMMTYLTIESSFGLVLLSYGLTFGIGIGIAYAVPLGCAMRWFPHHKGLVNGFVVAGFGGGAFIFNQVQTGYINPDNLKLGDGSKTDSGSEKYFHDEDMLKRVPHIFLILGGCYAGMQLLGSLLVCDPPDRTLNSQEENETLDVECFSRLLNRIKSDYGPTCCSEEEERAEILHRTDGSSRANLVEGLGPGRVERVSLEDYTVSDDYTYTPKEMLKSPHFYVLWFMFVFNGQGSLFISSLYKAYGQTFIYDDSFLALVGAFAAIFNAGGRLWWGFLADRFSFRVSMLCMTTCFTCFMLTLDITKVAGKGLFFVYVCLLFGSFSGSFSLFPTAIAKCFGRKYISINYGILFTSQFVTAPLATFLSAKLKDLIGWDGLFFLVAGFSFTSFLLAMCFRGKDKKGEEI